MICGITSPARCRRTWSPMRISLRTISSSLCRVALDTTTPPTLTGTRRATGVNAPVRPTCISISCRMVVAFSAGIYVQCPARNATKLPQPVLPIIAVNLIYHPVNIIIKLVPLRCDRIIMEQHPLRWCRFGSEDLPKTPFAQQVQKC